MTRVSADADLKRRLLDFSRELEICDETGQLLARVKPAVDVSGIEPLIPPASEEELDRRSKSSEKRFTTQEMLDYLGKL